MRSLLRGKPRSVSTVGLPSPPDISAFYSRLNHAYMHPLMCVKDGAAALALGLAHSITVPRGAASEYRICVSIIISAYGTTFCAGPRPLYCMHYNYMYCLIASRGGNVLCTFSLWACAYMRVYAWACAYMLCRFMLVSSISLTQPQRRFLVPFFLCICTSIILTDCLLCSLLYPSFM